MNAEGRPVLDLIILGMGEDGHVASLFPGAPEEVARCKSVYLPVVASKPPPRRITISFATIAAARQVWVLASGAGKERALRESLSANGKTPLACVLQERARTSIFTDITTGHVWYADYKDMLAADDGKPDTLASIHEVKISWNGKVYDTMFPIAEQAYQARGGKDPDLPGRATVSGTGRADARFTIDGNGELYLYSKTDGMIRAVVGTTAK